MNGGKMSAKKQEELYQECVDRWFNDFDKSLARYFLKLPIPMNYEFWCFLHKKCGDSDEFD